MGYNKVNLKRVRAPAQWTGRTGARGGPLCMGGILRGWRLAARHVYRIVWTNTLEVFGMIKLVCGIKGAGKTKRMVDMANGIIRDALGKVVFVDDTPERMFDLQYSIRLVNANEYEIHNEEQFFGFIAGLIAGDFDIHTIFVDHFLRMVDQPLDAIQPLLTRLDGMLQAHTVRLVLSISAASEDVPDNLKDRIVE